MAQSNSEPLDPCRDDTGKRREWLSKQRLVAPAGATSRYEVTRLPGLYAERSLVERDLLVASDLVGDLLPRRGDAIRAALRVRSAGPDLGQLILGHAVILE